jgi:hypothetical protein
VSKYPYEKHNEIHKQVMTKAALVGMALKARVVKDADPNPNIGWMVCELPDGTRFDFASDVYEGRLRIRPDWPRGNDGSTNDYYRPCASENRVDGVTYDMNRDPEKIAADAMRRFFALYVPQYAAMIKRRDDAEAYRQRTSEAADRLVKLTDCKHRSQTGGEFTGYVAGVRIEGRTSDGRADLKIDNLSVELAAELIDWIKRRTPKQESEAA